MPLRTDIADPVARLRSIKQFVGSVEDRALAVSARELTDIRKHAPAASLALSARMMAGSALSFGYRAPVASCTITNVPGPAIPLYLDGARMTYFSAIMPIYDGMGLVYRGDELRWPHHHLAHLLPRADAGPEFFAQCIRDSFQEYLGLAEHPKKPRVGRRPRAVRPRPKPPRRRRAA